ncbi:hypothetical protein [Brevibacterium litoralis]|uniref:hypothetical protein n=1 Tax=Brevibacterium litoralis TaxID=3138935 RepID=UPI0032EBA6E0
MKRLTDFLLNSPAAAVLAVLAAVVLLSTAIPPLHPHAWIIALVSSLVTLGVLVLLAREWATAQRRIDGLRAELAEARGAIGEGYSAAAITDQEPSEDTTRARRILDAFPSGDGLLPHLRLAGGFTPTPEALLEPVRAFLTDTARTRFDDPRVHTAFMELHRSAQGFVEWIDAETEATDEVREIRPGDVRGDGWREFSAAKEAGERRVDAFVDARRTFERIALETEVLP